ncbi:MAG TPA: glycosyltransferase family 4 protein [Kofleriaceae bacterium]
MKILLVTEYFPRSGDCEVRGGVEARAFYIARELSKRHSVRVLCTREPGEPIEDNVAGISVHRCGPERPYMQGGGLPGRAAFLRAAIAASRGTDADVVDGHNFLAYVIASVISRVHRIPRVATYHDVWLGDWVKNLGLVSGVVGEVMERYVLAQHWDQIIANSEATRQKLLAAHARTPNVEVVHNGIALEEFIRMRAPKFERPTICYVGRLVRYKRVDDLLHALVAVRQSVPNVKLEIVGSGPEDEALRALSSQLGLDANVEFHGFVPKHADVVGIMSRSHVLCLPSAVEGFGMAIIEAMACSTAVVASSLAPIREITRGGQGALLFECGDVAQLAQNLTSLLTDAALRDRCEGQARALAADYDWAPLAAKVEAVYESVLRH